MGAREKLTFKLGDVVRIKTGPFNAFTGRIEGINQSKFLLKVAVEIFGRSTPVKINFSDAEKVAFHRPFSPPFNEN
jgi:transcriptional antiterminator NusG